MANRKSETDNPMLKLLSILKYWKLIGVAIAILGVIVWGAFAYVSNLQERITEQAVRISQQDRDIATQATTITNLQVEAVQKDIRQNALDSVNGIKDRERQVKQINSNKYRGGRLQNGLLKKGNLTIDIINRATADSLQELQRATDNPIR